MKLPIIWRPLFDRLPSILSEKYREHMRSQHMDSYVHQTGYVMPETKRELERRLNDESSAEIRFLDLGAGWGYGVRDAKKLNLERIKSYGLSLHRPKDPTLQEFWILRHIEETVIPDFFHVIQSCHGLHHSVNIVGLENALNSLCEGGNLEAEFKEFADDSFREVYHVALKEYPTATPLRKRELEKQFPALALRKVFKTLQKQGFKVPKIRKIEKDQEPWNAQNLYDFYVPIVRGKKRADLSEFYEHPSLNIIPIPRRFIPSLMT